MEVKIMIHESIVAMIAIVATFGTAIIIVVALVLANIKKHQMEIEAYKTAVEKGLPVPILKVQKSPVRTLKAGIIWIAAGLGLFILIASEGEQKGLGVCAIPILIGIALIISYYIEKKSIKAEN
jgi:hypothetical protein